MPTRNGSGRSSRNVRIDAWAAASRVGSTSSAIIEPELSIASTIVACSRSTITSTWGRASAIPAATSASRKSAGGIRRRQTPSDSTTPASTSTLGKASAYFDGRRSMIQ
jgi:hypothetical protein